MSAVSRSIERLDVTFDDETLVANAGLIVPATLMVRLGLEALVNATVDSRPGRWVAAGPQGLARWSRRSWRAATHIDHADMLRAGATQRVLPFRVMAPSTLGTFLRAFTFGHVRQLDKVIAETLRRAWAAGAGPGDEPLTIDLDSTICEVHGKHKHGAAYGYTRVLGYHPILATRAETGEVLHARLRKGSRHARARTGSSKSSSPVCDAPARPARLMRAGRYRVLVLQADRHARSLTGALVDHRRVAQAAASLH